VTGISCVEIDGVDYSAEALVVHVPGGRTLPGTAITPQAPLSLTEGVMVTVQLVGLVLEPWQHTLRLHLETQELGSLQIKVKDTVR
jgi:hypothetical protein